MRNVLSLIVAFCWLTSPTASAALELREGQVQIALRADIAVAGEQVSLGDIAILRTRDLPTIQRLMSLSLGRAPTAGAQAVVRREAIARWIRGHLGLGREQVLWSGPDEARVRRLAQEIPGARLERTAETALRGWVAQRASRYQIQAVVTPGDLKVPAGPVELQVRPFADNAEPAQRMVVWLDVQVDGRFVRAVPVSFRVDAYRDAWVAPAGVANGVALAPRMVERREVKITGRPTGEGLPAGRLGSSPLVTGWRTTKPVGEGEPITVRNAAPAPLMARGEWVLLRLKSGFVELERRVQVMQDGDLGQVVQVRSSGGSAPVAARVMAAGRVEATL